MPHREATASLPDEIPVFPLPGAILFPRWDLPLNIFEPRYLNMLDDAMAGARLIGMIQPVSGPREQPGLASVGCAGRITSFAETEDGRYLITLSGVSRFRVERELGVRTPYRQVKAGWAEFAGDLIDEVDPDSPLRAALMDALIAYAAGKDLAADWATVDGTPVETLVNALSAGCPFSVMEKQALLEAPALQDRLEKLITLLRMDVGGPPGQSLQ